MSWLRGLLRRLADEGRTILISSHAHRGPAAAILTASPADGGNVPLVEAVGRDRLRVRGLDAPSVADLAAAQRLRVHELVTENASLEQLFLHLTKDKTTS